MRQRCSAAMTRPSRCEERPQSRVHRLRRRGRQQLLRREAATMSSLRSPLPFHGIVSTGRTNRINAIHEHMLDRGMGPLESTERSLMDTGPGAFTQGLSLTFQSFRRSSSFSCSRLAEHARMIKSLRQRNHATVSAANCQRNYGFTESVKHCTAQSTQKTQTIKP